MLAKIARNELESQTLTELRDWLLPMLINGQIQIQNSEFRIENGTARLAAAAADEWAGENQVTVTLKRILLANSIAM